MASRSPERWAVTWAEELAMALVVITTLPLLALFYVLAACDHWLRRHVW